MIIITIMQYFYFKYNSKILSFYSFSFNYDFTLLEQTCEL